MSIGFRHVADTVGTLAVVAVAAVLITEHFQRSAARSAPTTQAVETIASVRLPAERLANRMGTASPMIVEFADFECPFCGRAAAELLPEISRSLVATKKASYAYLQFPLTSIHPRALAASEAAQCAGRQNKYWEMHHLLFADRKALSRPDIDRYAGQLELQIDDFHKCIATESNALVKADVLAGETLGVRGTPTYFVGTADSAGVILKRRINGVPTFAMLQAAVDSLK